MTPGEAACQRLVSGRRVCAPRAAIGTDRTNTVAWRSSSVTRPAEAARSRSAALDKKSARAHTVLVTIGGGGPIVGHAIIKALGRDREAAARTHDAAAAARRWTRRSSARSSTQAWACPRRCVRRRRDPYDRSYDASSGASRTIPLVVSRRSTQDSQRSEGARFAWRPRRVTEALLALLLSRASQAKGLGSATVHAGLGLRLKG